MTKICHICIQLSKDKWKEGRGKKKKWKQGGKEKGRKEKREGRNGGKREAREGEKGEELREGGKCTVQGTLAQEKTGRVSAAAPWCGWKQVCIP